MPVFFFNDTATTEIYTLSLHDALPISGPRPRCRGRCHPPCGGRRDDPPGAQQGGRPPGWRSEEHTSELQSQSNLVCRLLLEKKNNTSRPWPPVYGRTEFRRVADIAYLS